MGEGEGGVEVGMCGRVRVRARVVVGGEGSREVGSEGGCEGGGR